MDAIIFLEEGDHLRLQMKDKQETQAIFCGYDFGMNALMVSIDSNIEAFEFDDIEGVTLEEPIRSAQMISPKRAIPQAVIDKFLRPIGGVSAKAVVNLPVGDGVLLASVKSSIAAGK
ncbi:hypothetical protein [Pseudomonas sp. LF245]